ncbi:PREDICTED: E3 ubiquitin-protein ligase TRIM58 [Dipodomys ordii]|uniref:E3 ubiquitin-protein ligase TRIM58 n=1 Tax=Dipodomys ordii TaxID=10020 RepID=A0A1S3F4V7_DIPOR|nr:PREDICTED: E3 ubiquitin-protein ligase TRIM58 [Dipodomys ordii]
MQPWYLSIRILLLSFLLYWPASGQFDVRGPQLPVIALVGEKAFLPCYLSSSMDASNMNITWYRIGRAGFVYALRNGEDYTEGQAPEYRKRTELLVENITNGHVLLKINSIHPSDGGIYTCYFVSSTYFAGARVTLLIKNALDLSLSSWRMRLAMFMIFLDIFLMTTCIFYACSNLAKGLKSLMFLLSTQKMNTMLSRTLLYGDMKHVKFMPAKKEVPDHPEQFPFQLNWVRANPPVVIITLHISVAQMKHKNSSTITELILVGFSNYPQSEIPLFFYLANCLGNTAVFALVLLNSSLQTPMYFFLCHLAFLNVSFSTVVVPKMLFNFLASRKVVSYTFCLVQTYLTLFLESAECFLLAVMAVDRYVAICYPLRYLILMNWFVCVSLASGAWIIGFFSSVVPLYFAILPLCGPYTVDYIFCELPILLHMFCGDTSLLEAMMAIGGAGTVLVPFTFIILSYVRLLVAVMRTDSGEGRKKAFSTCASHLSVVTIYYGTGLIRYLRPKSLYSAERDKLICVFYAVINPMLNPFIYSLRNKEVKGAIARILERSDRITCCSEVPPFCGRPGAEIVQALGSSAAVSGSWPGPPRAMASGAPGERLREEARCSVCLDFLQDPISVDCGHSFCLRCISEFCEKSESAQGGVYACPQCRSPFKPSSFRPNRQLASLVDSVRQLGLGLGAGASRARQCSWHREDLSRFCEEDQVALCWVCDTTPEHRGHSTMPLQEAARCYQVKLEIALEHVRKEMEEALTQEVNVGKKTVIWKEKVESQRQRFRLEFEKHRGFLAQEEQLQLRRLEEEERATLQKLRDSKSQLVQQNKVLKELVEELEQRCQQPALSLLEGVRDTLSRSSAVIRLEPETISMELKTVCCIPGMREMLRKFQVDVKLDPSTAHPSLLLTTDLRSVRDGELWRDVPSNPERFDTWPCVLGLQTFSSGRHYWEVVVGERAEWGLGVCQDTVPRKGESTPSPEHGVWAVWLLKGNEYMVLASPSVPLLQLERPRCVGIFLDYEAGEISFYNVTDGSHIYTFNQVFSGVLRPYFFICDMAPLFLPPMTEGEAGDWAARGFLGLASSVGDALP